MKYFALLLAAALLSACDTSQEDRDFYYSGWLHPERDANKRIYGGDIEQGAPPKGEPMP
jgi:hypothetical protein